MEYNELYNNCDLNKIRKVIVNYSVIIFGLIIIFIFILLGLYYITPNNYLIVKLEDNKFKLEDTNEYKIKSNSNIKIELNNNTNEKYLRFPEETNIVIKNILKSQNVIINNSDLIKSRYNSDIFIINNSDNEKNMKIQFYSIIQ